MLQQTTVAAVQGYYARFLTRFPVVEDLAAANLQDVLTAWAGLGYYSRARNLHRCAQALVQRGAFPSDIKTLETLPGIGPYTARAIAAIAFNVPVIPVDGNVERVTARLFAIKTPFPAAKKEVATRAQQLNHEELAQNRAADYAQALFDLGATICTPRRPECTICPWMSDCAAYQTGSPEMLPIKAPKKKRPLLHGTAIVLRGPENTILLRRRPTRGLLASMIELPGRQWSSCEADGMEATPATTLRQDAAFLGRVRHIFTHRELYLDVYSQSVEHWAIKDLQLLSDDLSGDVFICDIRLVRMQALASLTKKCLALAGIDI